MHATLVLQALVVQSAHQLQTENEGITNLAADQPIVRLSSAP